MLQNQRYNLILFRLNQPKQACQNNNRLKAVIFILETDFIISVPSLKQKRESIIKVT